MPLPTYGLLIGRINNGYGTIQPTVLKTSTFIYIFNDRLTLAQSTPYNLIILISKFYFSNFATSSVSNFLCHSKPITHLRVIYRRNPTASPLTKNPPNRHHHQYKYHKRRMRPGRGHPAYNLITTNYLPK